EHPTPLEPGRRYRVRLQLNDIAYRFPAGHRVRLALSNSYWPIVWPSPAPASVTIFTGASTLTLPERPARHDVAALAPSGEPEGAVPPSMTTLAPEGGSSYWRYEVATDTAETVSSYDSGLERFDEIGIAAGMRIGERYSIAAHDPLSAKASLAW